MGEEKLEPRALLAGMWNGTATVENSFVVSQKVRQKITMSSNNFALKRIPKRVRTDI